MSGPPESKSVITVGRKQRPQLEWQGMAPGRMLCRDWPARQAGEARLCAE